MENEIQTENNSKFWPGIIFISLIGYLVGAIVKALISFVLLPYFFSGGGSITMEIIAFSTLFAPFLFLIIALCWGYKHNFGKKFQNNQSARIIFIISDLLIGFLLWAFQGMISGPALYIFLNYK